MKLPFPRTAFAILIALMLASPVRGANAGTSSELAAPKARNVIFMVPDGLGHANVTAARIFKNGPGGPPLDMELRNVGYQRTYSADSLVTDSAAAASAWACGEKFRNREICYHAPGGSHPQSLLELAKIKGKGTGLVTNSEITDATPAAFGAHVPTRKCPNEIGRQYVGVTGVDILLGGGASRFKARAPDACGTCGDFLSLAVANGYAHVKNKAGFEKAVKRGRAKLLGLFADEDMDYAHDRKHAATQPRLSEMTVGALRLLQAVPEGFFLMVEGSLIDKANHSNDVRSQIMETLAFDEAVKTVLDWIAEEPARAGETLLIIAPDHDTGGFAITGPYKALPRKGDVVGAGWISGRHTAADTIIWSQGPGSQELNRPDLDNTDIYRIVKEAM